MKIKQAPPSYYDLFLSTDPQGLDIATAISELQREAATRLAVDYRSQIVSHPPNHGASMMRGVYGAYEETQRLQRAMVGKARDNLDAHRNATAPCEPIAVHGEGE